LLDHLSAVLVQCPIDAVDAHLGDLLSQVARYLVVDHAMLSRPALNGTPSAVAYRWSQPEHAPLETFDPDADLPWITGRLRDGKPIYLTRLEELPDEAASDRDALQRLGIRSIAGLPLCIGGAMVGWLMFGALREYRPWPVLRVEQLRRTARIVESALARVEAASALRRAVEFDQAVASLAATSMRAPVDQIDDEIVKALGDFGELLGADRAAVIQRDVPNNHLIRTHLWVRAGVPGPPRVDSLDGFPWLLSRLFDARELVALTRLDELPPEAARDRATLEKNGVVSGALAPMLIEDRVFGELMFATSTREQRWSPDLVARLRLLGEIIASALARRDAERALRSALAENERLRERLAAENLYLQAELVEANDFGEIVGQSAALRTALQKVRQVADTTAPVLLLGETGTGKELLARAIHAQSRRCARAFIAINCAALPPTLIESELFGHEKGAFTGATHAKAGRFELADQGTLLLDEIGELEPALQAKLLRVLEDGEIQRLGSTATRKVDVRLLAATNRKLRHEVRDGRFRSDLYYRLSVFPIELAPLRERRDDIPLLVWHFIQSRQRALGRDIRKISKTAMATLQAYEWPGNVRELQNVIERAMILSEGPVLRVEEALGSGVMDRDADEGPRAADNLRDTERAHIIGVLERCGWIIEGRGQAAERLGLNPSTLRNRMRKLGIKRPAR
jgi:transcriptional regulator with GAF, ATPase, and Fis domain